MLGGTFLFVVGVANAQVFDYALSEADEAGYGDYEGHNELPTTPAVGLVSGRFARGEEHAERDEEVAEDFGI